jgi:hypothetical protein
MTVEELATLARLSIHTARQALAATRNLGFFEVNGRPYRSNQYRLTLPAGYATGIGGERPSLAREDSQRAEMLTAKCASEESGGRPPAIEGDCPSTTKDAPQQIGDDEEVSLNVMRAKRLDRTHALARCAMHGSAVPLRPYSMGTILFCREQVSGKDLEHVTRHALVD